MSSDGDMWEGYTVVHQMPKGMDREQWLKWAQFTVDATNRYFKYMEADKKLIKRAEKLDHASKEETGSQAEIDTIQQSTCSVGEHDEGRIAGGSPDDPPTRPGI